MADEQLLTLAKILGRLLNKHSLVLSLAESCTGGMVSQFITAIPGSSAWFDRAFISYSNQAKIEMLKVSMQTLNNFGAVSEQTAHEMALGALNNSAANIAASMTGIAGPDGGSDAKPVGTVCFGFTVKPPLNNPLNKTKRQVDTHTQYFIGDRHAIRQQATHYVLQTLITLTLTLDL